MSKDERDFLDALRHRSIEAAAEILAGAQRLKSMYDEITDDGSGNPLPLPRLGDHFYQLAKFELEHASTLIRIGNSQAEMIFEHLRQLARRHQKSSSTVLTLEPTTDHSECVGQFEVRNPFDKPADLRFDVAEFADVNGASVNSKPSVEGRNGATTVRAYDSIIVVVTTLAPSTTLFGDVKVLLSADIEKQVAHRVIKVRKP